MSASNYKCLDCEKLTFFANSSTFLKFVARFAFKGDIPPELTIVFELT